MSAKEPCDFEPRLVKMLSDPGTDPDDWLGHVAGCESCQDLVESKIGANRWRDRAKGDGADLVAQAARPRPEDIQGYRILDEIGSGGQGTVYRALQESTSRLVALKVIKMDGSRAARVRVERECRIMSSFAHPELVRLYDSGESGDVRWLAMELIDGVHLDTWMLANGRSLSDRMAALATVARGVDVAHAKGILHRDLKPSNVLVDGSGHPTVLDFGLGRTIVAEAGFDERFTATGGFAGTIAYAAPEQLAGDSVASADVRADVYSLGVLAYLGATAQHPFAEVTGLAPALDAIRDGDFRSPRNVVPGVDEDLEAIILCAMNNERDDRYATASAFADDLGRWLRGEQVRARRAGAIRGALRKARRRPIRVAACCAALGALVLVGMVASGLVDDATASRLEAADLRAAVDAQQLIEDEPRMWPVATGLDVRCGDWLESAQRLFRDELAIGARLDQVADRSGLKEEQGRLERIVSLLETLRKRVGSVAWRSERSVALEASRDEKAWGRLAATMGKRGHYLRTPYRRADGLVPLQRDPLTGLWEAWHPASGTCPVWNEANGRWNRRPGDGLIFVLVPRHRPIGVKVASEQSRIRYLPSRWISKYPLSRAQWAALQSGAAGLGDIERPNHPVEGVSAAEAGVCLARIGLTVPTSDEYRWERWTPPFMAPTADGRNVSPMAVAEWKWGLVGASIAQAELVCEATGRGGFDFHYVSQSSNEVAQSRRWIRPVLLSL